jgi:hypothetical protein
MSTAVKALPDIRDKDSPPSRPIGVQETRCLSELAPLPENGQGRHSSKPEKGHQPSLLLLRRLRWPAIVTAGLKFKSLSDCKIFLVKAHTLDFAQLFKPKGK